MVRVVLVHLGPGRAAHLWPNIRLLKRNFPDLEVHLIYSNKKHASKVERSGAIPYFYMPDSSDVTLLDELSHNSQFRNGFWRFSLERLLALEKWQETKIGNHNFIHIESDILVLPSFPFSIFDSISKLMWCNFNESHDVSALLYSPNLDETKWLVNQIREEIAQNRDLTDMTVLSKIKMNNPRRVEYFPSLANSNSAYFRGVFDGAAIGMWLNGRDPRNHLGSIRRHLELPESIDKPEEAKFSLNTKNHLTATVNKKEYSIYNLHIHSKHLGLLSRFWRISLKLDLARARNNFPKNSYSVRALFSIAFDFVRRHKQKSLTRAIKSLKL